MFLILGTGVVGQAAIEYFKGRHPICLYDDKANIEDSIKFKSWEGIDSVIVSPGFTMQHHMIQEAKKRHIRITNDIAWFLMHWPGIKIGITGTNGKSTLCFLLKHILDEFQLSTFVGGNYGISPLKSPVDCDYYIIEVSSAQLEALQKDELEHFDIGIITNIAPHHLDRYRTFENYVNEKRKILNAKKKILGFCDLFNDWQETKAVLPDENLPNQFPNSPLFHNKVYQYHWGIINSVLEILNLDKAKALEFAKTYKQLSYRQEVVLQNPITVINDSKATNPAAAVCALKNLSSECCWIAGGANIEEWENLKLELEKIKHKIKKVFLINQNVELIGILKELNIPHTIGNDFALTITEAYAFAIKNKLLLLFSPGYQSFDKFKNFEERGRLFNQYINDLKAYAK